MANARQLKLGAVLVGVGNDQFGWRDPALPGNASVDIDWFIENARLAEESKSISSSWSIARSSPPTPRRTSSIASSR
jgi:hypothetical protein